MVVDCHVGVLEAGSGSSEDQPVLLIVEPPLQLLYFFFCYILLFLAMAKDCCGVGEAKGYIETATNQLQSKQP